MATAAQIQNTGESCLKLMRVVRDKHNILYQYYTCKR